MATKIKLIGRTTDFKGKPLWEILGNLKNFGIGRLVIRNMFQRYPEPCFMKIVKVEAQPSPTEPYQERKVKVVVEQVFRGRHREKLHEICSTSYKADYQLVPKDQEFKYLQNTKSHDISILPKTMEFPPLLRQFIFNETGNQNPVLHVKIQKCIAKTTRIAKDDEKPNVECTIGLGKPISLELYKGLNV